MLMQTETDGFTRRSMNKDIGNGKYYNNHQSSNTGNSNLTRRPNEQRMGTHHLPKINQASVEKQNSITCNRKPMVKAN